VRTAVGDPGFGPEFSTQVVVLARGGTHTATINLHPVELGPVSVSIQMTGQQASVALQASHEATREAIRQALPQLHDMFRASGLQLTQAQVGDGSAGNGAWREGTPARQQGTGAGTTRGTVADASAAGQGAGTVTTVRSSSRLLDTWA
jgi:flagellar hook-length control protein FliK